MSSLAHSSSVGMVRPRATDSLAAAGATSTRLRTRAAICDAHRAATPPPQLLPISTTGLVGLMARSSSVHSWSVASSDAPLKNPGAVRVLECRLGRTTR
eukprot:4169804-Prymnesium_polylepis.2